MRGRSREHRWSVVLDAPDARELADFYRRLLDWRIRTEEPDWVTVAPPDDDRGAYLGFQSSDSYVRPVWPPAEGQQQMMLHLDIEVGELDAATDDAVALGATVAEHQPADDVRVMLDPAGHPFCLWVTTGAPSEPA